MMNQPAMTTYSPVKTVSFLTVAALVDFGAARDAKHLGLGVSLLVGSAIAFVLLHRLAFRAPIGYEGTGGFHVVRPRRPRSVRRSSRLATLHLMRKRARWLTSAAKA